MPKEHIGLTEQLLAEIVQRIEAGANLHVAAEACGVPTEVFTDGLARYARGGDHLCWILSFFPRTSNEQPFSVP